MRQAGMFALTILALLVFQATALPMTLPAAAKPDLLLIYTVSCGLLFGREKALGVGFFSGLLQDLASGNIFGLHTLSKMAIGYLAGMAEQKVFKEHIILPMVAMFLASLLNSVLMLAFLSFLGHRIGLNLALAGEIMPSLLYNVLFSIPVHQMVHRLAKRLD